MKNFLKISMFLVSASLLFTACSNDDTWEPGPEDTAVGTEAYFPEQTSTVILSPMNPLELTAVVKRYNTESAASFPITVECTASGLTYPASCDFAAGESETQFVIDCSGLPIGEFQKIALALPEDQTNIYGEGLFSLSFKVIISDWKLISDNVTYYYGSDDPLWPKTTGKMYHLENTNYFRVTDFFKSGLDVMFQVNNSKKDNFTPLDNAYWEKDEGYNTWYLYDEANDNWFSWNPSDSSDLGIEYFYIYGDGYSKIYMLYNPTTLYGYGSLGGYLYLTDESWSAWMNLQFDFNLLYNPFE